MACRTVDRHVEKRAIAGDNRLEPVGCRWTTSCTGCGPPPCPQSVEILRPRIHNRLTWSDRLSTGIPVDTIWTTPRSPGCGGEKVAESVESGRNPAGNRTPGDLRAASRPRSRRPRGRAAGPLMASEGSAAGLSGVRRGRRTGSRAVLRCGAPALRDGAYGLPEVPRAAGRRPRAARRCPAGGARAGTSAAARRRPPDFPSTRGRAPPGSAP